MDFSLTTLFVVPSTNTLPSTGSTQDLTPGQLGVFLPTNAPATAGNIAAAKFVYFAQGRIENFPKGSKKSDDIYEDKVVEWYKMTGEDTAQVQITEISGLSLQCDQDITITLRLFSDYINAGFYNGLTRSVMVHTPCCDCGDDPCADLDATQYEAVIDEFVAKINAEARLSEFVVAERIDSGANSFIRITGLPLTEYGQPCDLTAFPFQFDRMYFYTFIHKGPETSQDYVVADTCDIPGTIEVVQRALYPIGTPEEVKQLEKNFYSYQTTHKHIFSDPKFNGAFTSYVEDGEFYDMYVLKFKSPELYTWAGYVFQDETVILAVPNGSAAATDLETLLTVKFGAPTDYSVVDISTTTTTSTTSSTTTTTTTTLFP